MQTLDDFVKFAENSHIVIADYESRLARLQAMIAIQAEGDDTPILRKWIADAHRRIEALGALYHYAKLAQRMPLDELRAVYQQLRVLKDN